MLSRPIPGEGHVVSTDAHHCRCSDTTGATVAGHRGHQDETLERLAVAVVVVAAVLPLPPIPQVDDVRLMASALQGLHGGLPVVTVVTVVVHQGVALSEMGTHGQEVRVTIAGAVLLAVELPPREAGPDPEVIGQEDLLVAGHAANVAD